MDEKEGIVKELSPHKKRKSSPNKEISPTDKKPKLEGLTVMIPHFETKETNEINEPKETDEIRDTRETKETKDTKDIEETKETVESTDSKYLRDVIITPRRRHELNKTQIKKAIAFLKNNPDTKKLRRFYDKDGKMRENLSSIEQDLHLPFSIVRDENEAFFSLESLLGIGGSAKVKYGKHLLSGEEVAIKIHHNDPSIQTDKDINNEITISKSLGWHKGSLERFKNAKIKRYNINHYFRGNDLTYHFLPKEILAKGRTVEQDLVTDFSEFMDIIISATNHLKIYYHDKDIIHRDIKPDNMIYDRLKREVNFIDFLTAVKLEADEYKEDLLCGTTFYLPPELKKANSIIPKCKEFIYSKAGDIYSLGISIGALGFGFTKNTPSFMMLECRKLFKDMTKDNPAERPSIHVVLETLQQLKLLYEERIRLHSKLMP